MKRLLIIFCAVAIVIFGVFYFTNNQSKTAKVAVDPYEKSLKQISSNLDTGSLLIDVRMSQEYEADHAVDAINLPLDNIQKGELPSVAKDKIIYVYCHSGERAKLAKIILERAGYSHVISISSLYNWVAMGGKVTGKNSTCNIQDAASC